MKMFLYPAAWIDQNKTTSPAHLTLLTTDGAYLSIIHKLYVLNDNKFRDLS